MVCKLLVRSLPVRRSACPHFYPWPSLIISLTKLGIHILPVFYVTSNHICLLSAKEYQYIMKQMRTGKWNHNRSTPETEEDKSKKQESRAVAREPRDAADVVFGLKFADNIYYKFKSSHASKARPQSSKRTGRRKTEFNAKWISRSRVLESVERRQGTK